MKDKLQKLHVHEHIQFNRQFQPHPCPCWNPIGIVCSGHHPRLCEMLCDREKKKKQVKKGLDDGERNGGSDRRAEEVLQE